MRRVRGERNCGAFVQVNILHVACALCSSAANLVTDTQQHLAKEKATSMNAALKSYKVSIRHYPP